MIADPAASGDWWTTFITTGQMIPFGALLYFLLTGKLVPFWVAERQEAERRMPDAAAEFDRLLVGLGLAEPEPPPWYRLRRWLYSNRRWNAYITKLAAEWRFSPKPREQKVVQPLPRAEIERTAGPVFGVDVRTPVDEALERRRWLERKAAYDERGGDVIYEWGNAAPVDYVPYPPEHEDWMIDDADLPDFLRRAR